MSELNAKTFDLAAVLAGQDYPEKTVDVYFNEALAFEVTKLDDELKFLKALDDSKYTELQDKFDKLVKDVEQYKYTFHLKAVPSRVKNDIKAQVDRKHPQRYNQIGLPEPDVMRDRLFASLMMQVYITKIVAPDGAEIIAPSLETITDFMDNAPSHALIKVENAIASFESEVANGFEVAAKSADFLSKP